jgi:hypothetical protein
MLGNGEVFGLALLGAAIMLLRIMHHPSVKTELR